MSRRASHISDSLDMLLDTITNTFGGVVFLAILIVMLMGSAKPEAADSQDIEELESIKQQIETFRRKKIELTQLQTAQQIVSALTGVQDNQEAYLRARDNARRYADIREQLSQMLDAKLNLGSQLQNSVVGLTEVNQKISSAKEQESAVTSQLEKEMEARNKQIDLPKEKLTTKRQTVVLIKANRLYVLDRNLGAGLVDINNADFEISASSDSVLVLNSGQYRLKENGGLDLKNVEGIRELLNRIDTSSLYLTVAIWGDSFGRFESVRDICKSLQLEYELILMAPEGKIAESARERAPKVQ